jgi:hypothetical protein
VGRPRLRWKQHQKGLVAAEEDGGERQGTGISGGELLKRPGPGVGCRAVEEGDYVKRLTDIDITLNEMYSDQGTAEQLPRLQTM